MITGETGHVGNELYVNGFAWSPCYLLKARVPLLFEAGFSCMARMYENDIRNQLHQRIPLFLFLTHVHYDHCGAASYLRKAFPGLKVCASRRSSEIIVRSNALDLIRSLSKGVVSIIIGEFGYHAEFLTTEFEPFPVDMVITKEETIRVDNDLSVQIMITPGHTRDMLSYYIPERKILIATESAGCLARNGRIVTEFLVDYDSYIENIRRFRMLDIEIFCQGHHYVFTGPDVQQFFEDSYRTALSFKEQVQELIVKEEGVIDNVVNLIKAEEYDSNSALKQPERAYLLNLRTRIEHLAKGLSAAVK